MSVPVMDDILRYKKRLDDELTPTEDVVEVLKLLDELEVDRGILSKTKIGISVARLKASPDQTISGKCRSLIDKWKSSVSNAKARTPQNSSSSQSKPSDSNKGSSHGHEGKQQGPAMQGVNSNSEYPGPHCDDVKRNKAREILFKALIEGMPEEQLCEVDLHQAGDVSAFVEESLWNYHVEGAAVGNPKEYQSQMRAVKSNLSDKKNPDFNIRILVGALGPEQLATMASVDMASDAKKKERQKDKKEALEACQSDWDLRNVKRAAGQFPCGKCKGDNTSYFQMQTRSSDEPMTTFVNCLNCGNRWKF